MQNDSKSEGFRLLRFSPKPNPHKGVVGLHQLLWLLLSGDEGIPFNLAEVSIKRNKKIGTGDANLAIQDGDALDS